MDALPPLADLHRHLDGSLRPATVVDLAAREGLAVPANLPFSKGMGLLAALERFDFTCSLLQTADALRRVAAEMCEDAAREGVTTLEIRFAPQLHLTRGLLLGDVIDAALEGAAGRAGIILCGLYGEPPAVLRALVDASRDRKGVVGIDLAGGPVPGDRWSLEDYAAPFAEAERIGLGRTVHAGEGRPPGEIRAAIEVLHAQRIGHGTTLLDDPSVLDLVRAKGVLIEACPTSNVHTGVIDAVTDHPIARWLDAGVRVCVCTDNTLLSSVDSPEEHRRALTVPGMSRARLDATIADGHAAAFRR